MNRLTMAAMAFGLSAGSALGAPRESVTFNNVPSFDLIGNAGNSTQLHTFTGSDGGGSYSATYLTVSGVISGAAGATFSREACIFVTPPGGGTPFIIQPYNGAATWTGALATPAGRYAVPFGAFTTAGEWSFQFFEQFNDAVAANDCVWDTVTITLDDGAVPTAPAGPNYQNAQSQTWTDVGSDGLAAAPGSTRTIAFNAGPDVRAFTVSGLCTGRTPFPTSTNANTLAQVLVRVTPPGQAAVVLAPFGATAFSTDAGLLTVSLATAASSSGTWTVDFYETADTAGGIDNIWNNVTLTIGNPAPPTNTPITIPGDGSFGSTSVEFTTAGQTKWYTFVLASPIVGLSGDFLDIDTEGSAIPDTSIGLYNSTGARVSTDFDDGTDLQSQLSYGIGGGPAPGNGVAYNGRDGLNLAADTYYIAVTAGNAGVAYQPGAWGVTNTNPNTGTASLNIRRGQRTATPPTATDLGAITAGDRTEVVVIAAAGEIKWYKITLGADVTNALGNWLDIDTEGTGAPITDTEVGVYSNAGALAATDDDDGSGNLTQLSFGQTTPVRPYPGTTGGNGRDGGLPAGTYYIAVGVFNVTFNSAEFSVTGTGTAVGNINLNFHTNLPAGPTGCNAADVAGLGGSIGPDGALTADDVVVYLAAFFSNNLAVADIAVLGGAPGQDGQLTADDIVYFLGQFFSPCN